MAQEIRHIDDNYPNIVFHHEPHLFVKAPGDLFAFLQARFAKMLKQDEMQVQTGTLPLEACAKVDLSYGEFDMYITVEVDYLLSAIDRALEAFVAKENIQDDIRILKGMQPIIALIPEYPREIRWLLSVVQCILQYRRICIEELELARILVTDAVDLDDSDTKSKLYFIVMLELAQAFDKEVRPDYFRAIPQQSIEETLTDIEKLLHRCSDELKKLLGLLGHESWTHPGPEEGATVLDVEPSEEPQLPIVGLA